MKVWDRLGGGCVMGRNYEYYKMERVIKRVEALVLIFRPFGICILGTWVNFVTIEWSIVPIPEPITMSSLWDMASLMFV